MPSTRRLELSHRTMCRQPPLQCNLDLSQQSLSSTTRPIFLQLQLAAKLSNSTSILDLLIVSRQERCSCESLTDNCIVWVFSTLMPSSEQSGHAIYNPSTSGRKLSGETWDISYGDGSGASGTVYADKVVVGGVTATSQAVEAATSVSAAFSQDQDNDGKRSSSKPQTANW